MAPTSRPRTNPRRCPLHELFATPHQCGGGPPSACTITTNTREKAHCQSFEAQGRELRSGEAQRERKGSKHWLLKAMQGSAKGEMVLKSHNYGVGEDSIKRGFGSWARSKTYRAGGASVSTPSLVSTPSEASVNSLSSAFSRFRAGKIFRGSPMGSLASSSSSMGDSSRGGTPIGLPNVPGVDNNVVTMSPMKIRLYRRDHPSKWRDLGNARLNVFKPMEGARPGKGPSEDDKRIVITNKKGDTVLLDVVLGESAFERVARTGIAVSVLTGEGEEDGTGKPSQSGGIGAKSTVYMMQVCCPSSKKTCGANRVVIDEGRGRGGV
ncbi:hypothetical protein FN846DRAFT_991200 [Sphaerosporella brunnea]|uniref:Uncharacterized protein n=1 Tax=Sphaerosporella brunnea TaxID=1250544 RepID=A0A5J5EPN7_9PEZI|nr:hypothetical protein FN846DRAFT_991200 [Sphaerosporella brunnea]